MFGLNEALISFIRRQVGLRTDAASSTGSLHAKVKDAKSKVVDINNFLTIEGCSLRSMSASDTERYIKSSWISGSTSKIEAFQIGFPIAGIARISFQLSSNHPSSSGTNNAEIALNGVTIKTYSNNANASNPITYTFDIGIPFGSIISVFGWCSGNVVKIANFRIMFDFEKSSDVPFEI